jgi:hypothetical protein
MTASPPAGSVPPGPGSDAARTSGADRVRDAIALALVIGGVALLIIAHVGNSRLATQPIVVAKGQTAFSIWMRYYYMGFAGVGAVIAGVLVGFGSYIIHARRVRRAARRGERPA